MSLINEIKAILPQWQTVHPQQAGDLSTLLAEADESAIVRYIQAHEALRLALQQSRLLAQEKERNNSVPQGTPEPLLSGVYHCPETDPHYSECSHCAYKSFWIRFGTEVMPSCPETQQPLKYRDVI